MAEPLFDNKQKPISGFTTNHFSQVGTGKNQAALLIELKDRSAAGDELYDSIWETVKKANATSLHKDQLHREYIMFAEADKPFIRTDKGTIKRRATLELYAEYIDRFYQSRSEEVDAEASNMEVDTTSIESITAAVREIFVALSSAFKGIPDDADFFHLGLDSLLAYRAVRSVQAAMGLKDRLAPRHLYAYPTVAQFSACLKDLASQTLANGSNSKSVEKLSKMKELLSKYKSPQTLKMNALDHGMPSLYTKIGMYIPLRPGASFDQAFSRLQQGFARLITLLPALDAKMVKASEKEPGYIKGQLRLELPEQPLTNGHTNGHTNGYTNGHTNGHTNGYTNGQTNGQTNGHTSSPRQLKYKDLSKVLPSFQNLQKDGFLPSAYKGHEILDAPWFPTFPSDIVVAQANFVEGGCLLTLGTLHPAIDGVGMVTLLLAWAECCRYVEGDKSANCSWLDADSMNYSLPRALWEQDQRGQPAREIDPVVWDHLGFAPAGEFAKGVDNLYIQSFKPVPAYSPGPGKQPRDLASSIFSISPESLEQLRQQVTADPEMKGINLTDSDILHALYWRAMIRARHRVAREIDGRTIGPEDRSVLELTVDGRPYFNPQLPSSYMGNMLLVTRSSLSVEELCSPKTSIGRISLLIREAASQVTPQVANDAFSLLQTVQDFSELRYAFMRLDGLDAMITNMMLFPANDVAFGGEFFEDGGKADAVRIIHEGFNSGFRMCIILPYRKDGGIEFLFGTFPEELERLKEDEEFMKYAKYMG